MYLNFLLSAFSVFIVILGLVIFFPNHSKKINRNYLILNTSIGLFCLALTKINYATNRDAVIIWYQGLLSPTLALIPACLINYTSVLTQQENNRKIINLSYLASGFFIIVNIWGLVFNIKFSLLTENYYLSARIFYPLYMLFLIITLGYSSYLSCKSYKVSFGLNRQHLQYHILGNVSLLAVLVIFLLLGFKKYFLLLTIPISIFYAITANYSLSKPRLLEIKALLNRLLTFLLVYTFVALMFYLGTKESNSVYYSFVFMFFLASFAPFFYIYLYRKIEDVIFAKQRGYRKKLLNAASGMNNVKSLKELLTTIVNIFTKETVINRVAMFFYDADNHQYRGAIIRGRLALGEYKIIKDSHPIIKYLLENRRILHREELNFKNFKNIDLKFFKGIRDLFESLDAQLFVPAFDNNVLLGFMILGDKADNERFSDEDIHDFEFFSQQAALAISNTLFIDRFKKAKKRINTVEAEKIASLDGIAQGVAHIMRNRLNHFSMASGDLKLEVEEFVKKEEKLINENLSLQKVFNYILEISESLLHNVQKTSAVIDGVLNFLRVEYKDINFSQFSFQELIDLSLERIRLKRQIEYIPLVVKENRTDTIFAASDIIYAIKAQALEVIFNLLDNAYDSIEEKKMKLTDKARGEFIPHIEFRLIYFTEMLRIEIIDNGVGITYEDRSKIFAPFFTTKSSYACGGSVGMYVVKRIIEENHQGKIWFESELMKGTRFFIELPYQWSKTKNSRMLASQGTV